jgi:phosphoribosylglycinamide formyltransferase 1
MGARFTILISGGGGLMRRVIECSRGAGCPFTVSGVIASRDCPGVHKARELGADAAVVPYCDAESFSEALFERIDGDAILLLGFLHLLHIPPEWTGRVINIHPSLLPKFGGRGMYGRRVHEAVLAAGEAETGSTIHLADEAYDRGEILDQVRVPVLPGDTAESLETRVIAAQHEQIVPFLHRWAR